MVTNFIFKCIILFSRILNEKINRRKFTINICEYKTLNSQQYLSEKLIDYYIK